MSGWVQFVNQKMFAFFIDLVNFYKNQHIITCQSRFSQKMSLIRWKSRFLIMVQRSYQNHVLFSFIWQFIQLISNYFVFLSLTGCSPQKYPKNCPLGCLDLKIYNFGSFYINLAKKWILNYRGPRVLFRAKFYGQ